MARSAPTPAAASRRGGSSWAVRRAAVVVLAATSILVTGCGPGPSVAADGERAGAAVGSVVGPRTGLGATSSEPVWPVKGPVTIAFGGDIHFEGPLAAGLAADPHSVLDPVAEMMGDADLAIANLETAITDRGVPSPKQFNFRADASAFRALHAAGIDVVSMANNHGMDYGLDGLRDTLAAAEANDFPVVGGGETAEQAYGPWSTVVNGQRIAVLGATQVIDSSLIASWTATVDQPGLASAKEVDALVAAVAAARTTHDTVIVFLHWGIEGHSCPAPRQIELSDRLIEAGADIVVGGHAHRVQGGGIKRGALVHYGLGNFVFNTPSGAGADSGVLEVTVDGRTIIDHRWIPARLERGVATRLDEPSAAEAATEAWGALRDCTDLEP